MIKVAKKLYFLILLLALVDLLLAFFAFFFFLREIQKSSQDFLIAREKISSLTKEREDFGKIKIFYQNHQSDFEKIEKFFVDPDVPIDFISFLEKTAQDCQLQLKINSLIKNQSKENTMPSLSFQLSLQGFFPNFLRFLEKIENGPYLVETVNLNTQSAKEENVEKEVFEKESQISLTIQVVSK